MRRRALAGLPLAAAAVLGACGAPAATAAPQPPSPDVTPAVYLSEGGLLRPVANGARVPIADGSVQVSFAPYPPATLTEVDVVVRDAVGEPVDAEVVVLFEMIGMEHGVMSARAVAAGDHHRASVGLPMPGAWRFVLRIGRPGEVTSLLFIVPDHP